MGTARRSPGDRRQTVYARSPDVEARKIGEDMFLSSGSNGTIHRLDPMASAFWSSLEQPRSLDRIMELFATAFPDMPSSRIERDLARLAVDLEKRGLITVLKEEAPPRP
jgi:hypothetical protein